MSIWRKKSSLSDIELIEGQSPLDVKSGTGYDYVAGIKNAYFRFDVEEWEIYREGDTYRFKQYANGQWHYDEAELYIVAIKTDENLNVLNNGVWKKRELLGIDITSSPNTEISSFIDLHRTDSVYAPMITDLPAIMDGAGYLFTDMIRSENTLRMMKKYTRFDGQNNINYETYTAWNNEYLPDKDFNLKATKIKIKLELDPFCEGFYGKIGIVVGDYSKIYSFKLIPETDWMSNRESDDWNNNGIFDKQAPYFYYINIPFPEKYIHESIKNYSEPPDVVLSLRDLMDDDGHGGEILTIDELTVIEYGITRTEVPFGVNVVEFYGN
jgi:hypothetical protein